MNYAANNKSWEATAYSRASTLTSLQEMGMTGIYSADGRVHGYEVFVPFLESVSEAVLADSKALRIVSQKPLKDSIPSVLALNHDGWHDLEVHPELNSWVTHLRFRILARIDISDHTSPTLDGTVLLSDGDLIWTYALRLEQTDVAETITLRLRSKTKTGNPKDSFGHGLEAIGC